MEGSKFGVKAGETLIWIALGDDADPELWIEVGSMGRLAVGLLLLFPQAVANETAETTSNILRAITIGDRNPPESFIFLLYRNLRTTLNGFACFPQFYNKIKQSVASPWSVGLISLTHLIVPKHLKKVV
jgi:hypothetical protein